MIKEAALNQLLINMVEHQKFQSLSMTNLLAEIASLRDTVSVLDPTFAETKQAKWESYRDQLLPEQEKKIQLFDSIVQELKNGSVVE